MDEMTRNLEQLGKSVADELEQAPPATNLQAARSRFLAASIPSPKRKKRAFFAMALAGTVLAAAALYWSSRPPNLSFAIGSPPAPGVVGSWISAGNAPTDLRFSEGTALSLAPGARVRVTETNAKGAAVLIENGRLHAKVTHARNDSRWAFHAGPFQVRVTGTEFDASWDPASETFEMTMSEGSVFTTGPLLHEGRALVAGEKLRISMRDNKLEINLTETEKKASVETTDAPVIPKSGEEVTKEPANSPAPASTTANHSDPGVKPPPSASVPAEKKDSDWRSLASAGKYKDALAAAEKAGFAGEIARSNATELMSLADAARLGGSPARAREALMAARTRFGARGRTAFLIGKIAADQQGSSGEAATWFDTYLREEPGGALAEQALGRLIEIRRRGDAATARSLAERYLAKYPQGAYAALARSVLEP